MPLQRGMSASGTPIPSELEFERKKGRDGMTMLGKMYSSTLLERQKEKIEVPEERSF